MAPRRTTNKGIKADVEGGVVQGFVGTGNVRIENLNFYGSPLPGQPPQGIDEGAIPPCPYPGLAYFGPQDSALFFGRDTAIARLEAAVTRQTLTALVGASGSGKSSVVLAGLAPRLHSRGGWRFSHFRVGTEHDKNPFLALARALVPLLGEYTATEQLEEVQKLAVKLDSATVSLPNVMGACRASKPNRRILLIADQFEEVFTLVGEEALRNRFIDTLLAGFLDRADGDPPNFCLVLTLRADFYGMALRHRPLADALQGRVENLGPMTRDELREAIVRPAGAITFENGLIDALLDDVASRPGSLPLLQFALREMWGRLDNRRMTRAAYDAIGGVEGALAQRAQAIFDTLTMKGGDTHAVMLFRQLFTRLVSLSDGAEDTRRVVGREELGQQAWALAQRLADEDNRLVVTGAPAADHETVELTHEALIRNWPTFVEWVDRDRVFQSWLRQLKPRVEEWRRHPEDDGTLLRGGPLKVAEEWLQLRRDEVNDEERAYIEAAVALREAVKRREEEALAREEAKLAEVKAAQRRVRRMGVLAGVLFVAMVAGVGVWWKGLWLKEGAYRLMHVRVLPAKLELALRPGDPPFNECTDCPKMVVVPAGSFTMGSPDGEVGAYNNERPRRLITIATPFAVSEFELTFDEWGACVAYGDCDAGVSDSGWGRGQQPVINVTWDDAQRYVAWLRRVTGKHYRLLTEAEWEYAARAGSAKAYSWGDEIGVGKANCDGCGSKWDNKSTAPVGSFTANTFGLYDMHGNVWELVEDCYRDSYEGAPSDGSAVTSADCSDHVVRGGSWFNDPKNLRSAVRSYPRLHSEGSDPETKREMIGFRIARTLSSTAPLMKSGP